VHDTPTRDLFARQERSFSSGCVRLSEPFELARWLLQRDGRQQEAERMNEILEAAGPEVIYLREPVPTYLVYFTAMAQHDGQISFRRDLYGRDDAIVAALRRQS
jgi:L,D-transpeptidase YcbB